MDCLPGIKVELLLPKHWWRRAHYRLLEPISLGGHYVPAGFVSDGATVPRLFWSVFPPVCRYFKAAVVHDFYLRAGVPRSVADLRLKQCLKLVAVTPWRAWLVYWTAHIYGRAVQAMQNAFLLVQKVAND